jgi:hypothetical protein
MKPPAHSGRNEYGRRIGMIDRLVDDSEAVLEARLPGYRNGRWTNLCNSEALQWMEIGTLDVAARGHVTFMIVNT